MLSYTGCHKNYDIETLINIIFIVFFETACIFSVMEMFSMAIFISVSENNTSIFSRDPSQGAREIYYIHHVGEIPHFNAQFYKQEKSGAGIIFLLAKYGLYCQSILYF